MYNKIVLMGRLVRDVDIRYTDNGKIVGKCTLAVDRKQFTKNAAKETDFVNCTVFGKRAEVLAQHVFKGHRVMIEGALRITPYTDKNGTKRVDASVMVDDFVFVEAKGTPSGSSGNGGWESMGDAVSAEEVAAIDF